MTQADTQTSRPPFDELIRMMCAAFGDQLLADVPELSSVTMVLTYKNPEIINPYAVIRGSQQNAMVDTVRRMQQLLRLLDHQMQAANRVVTLVDTTMHEQAVQLAQQLKDTSNEAGSATASRPVEQTTQ